MRVVNRALAMSAGIASLLLGADAAQARDVIIDFDGDTLGAPLAAGQPIDEQFAPWGVHISAVNPNRPHDLAIIFDTSNPTGGDTDLATPGYHPSNTEALGNVLILAEQGMDGDGDGLVDVPDDEGTQRAGEFVFELDFIATGLDLQFIDVEEHWSIDFYYDGAVVHTEEFGGLEDNAVELVTVLDRGKFDAFVINAAGSGALDMVMIMQVPTPGGLALLAVAAIARNRRRRG